MWPSRPNRRHEKIILLTLHQRVIGLLLAALLQFFLFGYFAFFPIMTSSTNIAVDDEPPEDLSSVYKEIASRALSVENWPDTTTYNKLLRRDALGVFQIPSFPVSEAPLAVVTLLDQNPAARQIIRECDEVFELFLNDLQNILPSTGWIGRNVWRSIQGTHHITIAVFQENPSLLINAEDRKRCRTVPEDVAEELFSQLSTRQLRHANLVAPILQLDSLVITGDGVMIAGFVEQSRNSFRAIRNSCLQIAGTILGELTSRPKKLIHVTVGRVLELPRDTNQTQQIAVNQLVREYNSQILPEKVAIIKSSLPNKATFALTEVTMIRDVVWMLRKIKTYGSWRFPLPADD